MTDVVDGKNNDVKNEMVLNGYQCHNQNTIHSLELIFQLILLNVKVVDEHSSFLMVFHQNLMLDVEDDVFLIVAIVVIVSSWTIQLEFQSANVKEIEIKLMKVTKTLLADYNFF